MGKGKIPHIKGRDFLINLDQPARTDDNYVEFWLKHLGYCRSGVIVGGVYFSGWMYWHINFFKVMLDVKDEYGNKDREMGAPHLRDNEWYINWAIDLAKVKDKPLMFFGSRRIAKSVILTSRAAYTVFIKKNSHTLIIGADSEDLGNITKYFEEFYEKRPDCFSDIRKYGVWKDLTLSFNKKEVLKMDQVTKKKGVLNPITPHLLEITNENSTKYSSIAVKNLEHGKKLSKKELLAGTTPSEVIFDEALWEDEIIPTFTGTKKVKELFTGDKIIGDDGKETTILERVDVGEKPLYNVKLVDGRELKVCEDHLFGVYLYGEYKVLAVKELILKDNLKNYCIKNTVPINYPDRFFTPFLTELNNRTKDSQDSYTYISNITDTKEVEQSYCFRVDNESKLFLAGDHVVTHNCGKFGYNEQYSALKPALMTSDGELRSIILFAGTGGSVELSVDAENDFLDAETSGFLPVDVEEYKKEVKPEYFQYTQISEAKAGLFPPAQMSNAGGKKTRMPLSQYLKKDFSAEEIDDLDGITIHVTNWETAREKVETQIAIDENRSEKDGKKAKMYYPFQPEDCFLNTKQSDYPIAAAKLALKNLKAEKKFGEFVDLSQDSKGNIIVTPSDKDIVRKFPFPGGAHDAPVVIYEHPISDDPDKMKYGTNIAGFDGYKIATSKTTDSVGSCYIYKRKSGVSGYQNQIVASIASRPTRESVFYKQIYLLLKYYNAEILPERDVPFFKYMENIKQDWRIAKCDNIVNTVVKTTSNAATKYGLPATPPNKEYYLKKVQDYCWEPFVVGYEDDGTEITLEGVHRIPDPLLLEEIIKIGDTGNYDRIAAFGHALVWDHELTERNVFGGVKSEEKKVFNHKSLIDKMKAKDGR